MIHKTCPSPPSARAFGEGTASCPNGQAEKRASLRHCRPNGIVTISTNRISAQNSHPMALHRPTKTNHRMLPMVFTWPAFHAALRDEGCGGQSHDGGASDPTVEPLD